MLLRGAVIIVKHERFRSPIRTMAVVHAGFVKILLKRLRYLRREKAEMCDSVGWFRWERTNLRKALKIIRVDGSVNV